MSKGKDEHGHALIDGLVLLIVLSAVPLALLWGVRRQDPCDHGLEHPAHLRQVRSV